MGFAHPHIHDNLLKRKGGLLQSMRFGQVWINPDEPIEIRKLKSRFRQIAYKARQDGQEVYFNHQYIKKNDCTYYEDDRSSIPEEYKAVYRPKPTRNQLPFQFTASAKEVDHKPKDTPEPEMDTPTMIDQETLPKIQHTPLFPPPRDGSVKMRLTKAGWCFSGKTAFVSNHYEREFVFEEVDHRTVDHGFCLKKATCYKRPDLADKVREAKTALVAKDVVRNLGLNPEWQHLTVPTLLSMFDAKMTQHPDLFEACL